MQIAENWLLLSPINTSMVHVAMWRQVNVCHPCPCVHRTDARVVMDDFKYPSTPHDVRSQGCTRAMHVIMDYAVEHQMMNK